MVSNTFLTKQIEELTKAEIFVFGETLSVLTKYYPFPFDDTYKTDGSWTIDGLINYVINTEQILDIVYYTNIKIMYCTLLCSFRKMKTYFENN